MGALRPTALVFSLAIASVGCHKTFYGSVTQPNPLKHPTETLRISEKVTIVTGDMELSLPIPTSNGNGRAQFYRNGRYPLRNSASFTVVSRDRLRFHVQIEHKWEEYAKLKSWTAYLVDDQGRKYRPEAVEQKGPRHVVHMWDRESRTRTSQYAGGYGRQGARDDAHMNRQTLGSLSVFRGKGDLVFYSRDIFSPKIKWMTLVVERRGLAFAWTWRFQDQTGPPGTSTATASR